MNTNEEMIFDELMRQKLGNYSESPDMGLMDNIHTKKNRIIKLYRLSKIFAVLCIVGLSFLGSYMLNKPGQMTSVKNPILNNSVSAISENNKSELKNHLSSTANNASTHSSDHVTKIANQSINGIAHQSANTTQSSAKLNDRTLPQSLSAFRSNSVGQTLKNTSQNTSTFINSNKTDSVKEKQNEQKAKKKEANNACKAAFDYYASYDGIFNFTNFSDADATAKMLWDFGDGTTSDQSSPNHTYKNNGNYLVTLKITDISNSCNDVYQKNLVFGSVSKPKNQSISIKGTVIAGTDHVDKGSVSLMSFNPDKNVYSQIAKSNISLSGEYSFYDLKTGTYLLLADANNSKYVPTYWGNVTDMIDAVEVHIMENDMEDLSGLNISMVYNKDFNNGDVARIFSKDTGSQNYVLVLDQNNNVVGTAKIENNGSVNLSAFPPGNYNLLNQQTGNITGIKTTPGNAIIGGVASGTGVGAMINGNITLVPNPAINNVKFNINISDDNEEAEIMIMNATGSLVYHKSYNCTAGSYPFDIDISGLPSGEYYVVVNVGGMQTLSGRMIKSGNNSSNNR